MTVLRQLLFLITTLISVPTTAKWIFYVLPDNSTSTSCPFQPCATLSQYMLDNGSLPVVSNIEYHFLPGEHYIPTSMRLQYLHNFTITGRYDYTSIPTVIIGSLITYLKVFNSVNVSIENVIFKKHNIDMILHERYRDNVYNLAFVNCVSCKIIKVNFLKYGFRGENLVGESYLNDIVMELTNTPLCCFSGIYLSFVGYSGIYHSEYVQLVINRISMTNIDTYYAYTYNMGIHIQVLLDINFVNVFAILIVNSSFFNMSQRVLDIFTNVCITNTVIMIENCTFRHNKCFHILDSQHTMINGTLSHHNVNLTFINCQFFDNNGLILLSVYIGARWCWNFINASFALSSKITITNCSFFNNYLTLIKFLCNNPLVHAEICFNGPVRISGNQNDRRTSEIMHIVNFKVHIKGPVYISRNSAYCVMSIYSTGNRILLDGIIFISSNAARTVMQFYKSYVIFNGPITVSQNMGTTMLMNKCNVTLIGPIVISMNRASVSTMLLQYSDVLFTGNILFESNYCNKIITLVSQNRESAYIEVMQYSNITFSKNRNSSPIVVETDNNNYYNIYPTCIFQYVTLETTSVALPSHYTITISADWLSYTCELSFYRFFSHCKWISEAEFQDHKPEVINQQIIQLQHKFQYLKYHSVIFYCPNFNANSLGPVYPGQKLQLELCIPCSDNYSILYAETHNTLLPQSACKIAHQSEIVNFITNKSKIVSYTIVSEVNDSCELFLTVSPFLYDIYEVFDVKLLPCPIGFTLQNGVCDCDPLLPTDIDTCYIDQSAIRCPANTWISYTQSSTSKYLISDCPMDYCVPFSSNVNLLHPDTQCQFNRTGILCSQCQHDLSMVFGSSRCMKCTNVHILITIIVIVAGVVLVVLLYLLNLTVTKATINGIILYANIISINYSVFLTDNNIFNPLQIFISFTNLDLGFETCFYNGMNSYVKMWLNLFFPILLIIISFSIIIASRYSSRILRLTYSRSLPVLATLFLLSYTSVLRTVLTVLFSYSTITHVPSGHQELVWSVDASVPLFGLKFTILFITCLVLFLILLFFNIILLFTRCLTRFRVINYFKPILDAFQGPYKDRYYYWVAVNIMLRSIFFALYAFQTKFRLVLATVLLGSFTGIFGYIRPNKSKLLNFQELLLLINLTIMHAVSYYSNDNIFGIVTNLMISLAFIQFCIIVTYHFLTYTCHCNIENTLHRIKEKWSNYFTKDHRAIDVALLNIPECAYNYSEYQDGLVSDDFVVNN